MSIRNQFRDRTNPTRITRAAVLACLCAAGPAVAEDGTGVPTGFSLWGEVPAEDGFRIAPEQSALRPSASWSWKAQPPQLDFAAGVGHRFAGGLSLNLGVSLSHADEPTEINYRDYFLGLSYGRLDGKLWYLPEVADSAAPSAMYYEAGWSQPVSDKFSVSLRVGQQLPRSAAFAGTATEWPNLSLGATGNVRGYGLGLRLIDSGGHMFGGDQDFRVMGSISKPFP